MKLYVLKKDNQYLLSNFNAKELNSKFDSDIEMAKLVSHKRAKQLIKEYNFELEAQLYKRQKTAKTV